MYKLGIDIGSTTIKMALVEVQGDDVQSTKEVRILATDYRRHNAEPMKVGQEMIEGILNKSSFPLGEDRGEALFSIGITGSVVLGCAQRLSGFSPRGDCCSRSGETALSRCTLFGGYRWRGQ